MLNIEELHFRAALFRQIRSFFHQNGFLEVDTPIRLPVLIPESNIEPISSESQFMQTSPELCMKRLLALGCEKIYQLTPCFRKEERGSRHLEEFMMLEWYRMDADYFQLMDDCYALMNYLDSSLDSMKVRSEVEYEFSTEWEKITVDDAFRRWGDISAEEALSKNTFDEIMVEKIEPNLGRRRPAILYDYPVECGSLARRSQDNPEVAERFELYFDGVELANGFSELTDPVEQRQRFTAEITSIEENSGRKASMPEKFLTDLDRIDTAAGIALGLDRLTMFLLGKEDISGAVPFCPDDFEE